MNNVLKRIGIVIAALIPVAIVGAFVFKGNDEASSSKSSSSTTSTTTPTTTSTTTPSGSGTASTTTNDQPTTTTADTASTYTDGTYTATGSYTAPDGPQSVTVTLTIKNDTVTAASLVENAKENTASGMWQVKFASGYETMVVGKNLADLKLTKVSGSSLTPIGFNAAVADIQAQAKA